MAGRTLRRAGAELGDRLDAGILITLLGGVAALHLAVTGGVPTGADPGNWLALAQERLGTDTMSAEVTYPPVFPLVLGLLRKLTGEAVSGLFLAAVLAHGAVVVATYLLLRRTHRLAAVLGVVVVATAGYQAEAFAWGAYPQLLATGIAVLLVRYVVSAHAAGVRHLGIVLLGVLLTLGTHKLVGVLLLPATCLAVLHRGYWLGTDALLRRRMLLALACAAVPVLVFAGVWVAELAAGLRPVVNPTDVGRLASLQWVVREAPVPWLMLSAVAVVGMADRGKRGAAAGDAACAAGWTLAGLLLFALVAEPRALLPAQIGIVVLALQTLRQWLPSWAASVASPAGLARPVLLLSLLGAVVVPGAAHYQVVADWYRVVDRQDLATLDALRELTAEGDVLLASRSRNGHPVGWWVEGYVGRPAFSAMDPRYAAFPLERAQARIANAVLHGRDGPAAGALDRHCFRFIVVDRRGPDGGWVGRARERGLVPVLDTDSLVVFEHPNGR
jgi:hypothetical protein